MIIGVGLWYSCGERRRVGRSLPILQRNNCGIPNLECPFYDQPLERGKGYTRYLSLNFDPHSMGSLRAFEILRFHFLRSSALALLRPLRRSRKAFFSGGQS